MNKKLLLGALIGAGMSMLNKKIRQQSPAAPGTPPPDFSKVPAPDPGGAPGLDDILARATRPGGLGSPQGAPAGGAGAGGDIFGGAVPAGAGAGGAAVLMEMARRIFAQMQQQGGPGGAQGPGGAGAMPGGPLGEIFGQIFGRGEGKFGQQGQANNPGQWQQMQPRGKGGLFGFVNTDADADGDDQQAEVMLKAMVAAAQADGTIDEQEQQNILQSLQGQLEPGDLDELRTMLTTPVALDDVVAEVDDPASAFNLYLVSAMTINPDNAAERAYLESLAQRLGISEQAAQLIERQIPRS